jgi:DNA-binding Lrp family transcriptional regulator
MPSLVKDTIKIDRLDLKILINLQKQGRITNQNLAEKVNLSPSSCLHRVRRLEEMGIIESYQANIRLAHLCRSITCIATVTLNNHTQEDFVTFEKLVQDFPPVIESHTVSGGFDFFLKVIAADMAEYLEITNRLIKGMSCGVNINTHVVMKELKAFRGYPLDLLV